jgi:hypothetical protein
LIIAEYEKAKQNKFDSLIISIKENILKEAEKPIELNREVFAQRCCALCWGKKNYGNQNLPGALLLF